MPDLHPDSSPDNIHKDCDARELATAIFLHGEVLKVRETLARLEGNLGVVVEWLSPRNRQAYELTKKLQEEGKF